MMKFSEKRCVPHVLIIPVTRTLKGRKPMGAKQVPPSGYDKHPAPEYLKTLEVMRAVCLWLAGKWIVRRPVFNDLQKYKVLG